MANQPEKPDTQVSSTIPPRVSTRYRDWVMQQAEENDGDNWEVTAGQLDKMLTAETLESIMNSDSDGPRQARDLVDFEFTVPDQEFQYRKSSDELESALGAYMQFHAIALMEFPDQDIRPGDEIIISTGAPLIMGKLRTLQANGFLPQDLKIVHGGGKGVLKVKPAPKRTVQGKS